MKKTAIIYARVSSVGQAEDELPLDGQIEACRREAAALGAEVVEEFVDAGISGRTVDRPAFLDAIARCKAGRIDYFITWSTSRFARNRIDAPAYKVKLKRYGTSMVYVSNRIDNSTKEGWMMEGILELWDEYQSRSIADDTTRSMLKNARDGFFNGGTVPFGYQAVVDGRRKRLQVVEHEAAIIREMFMLCLSGRGCKAIANMLNQRNVRRRGGRWSKSVVNYMLRSWAYAGYLVFNRTDRTTKQIRPESEWIKTRSHEAIIEEGIFMKVQNIISDRAPEEGEASHRSLHFFSGMLRCGVCGSSLMIETATGRSKIYSYYNCSSFLKGRGCESRRFRADLIDQWLADYIIGQIMSLENLRDVASDIDRMVGSWAKDRIRRRDELVSQLRDAESRRRRLYNLLEEKDPDAFNLGDLKPRLMQLNTTIQEVERKLTALELEEAPDFHATDEQLGEIQGFVRDVVMTGKNPKKIRDFFAGFVESVVVFGDAATVNYRKDRLVTLNAVETVQSEKGWLPVLGTQRTARVVVLLPDRFRRAA